MDGACLLKCLCQLARIMHRGLADVAQAGDLA
jgi:hypothetical protein